MSPVRLRPDLHLPWQVLAAFAAALYVLRSALRGWDFRLSVLDLIVFGGLAAILTTRSLLAARIRADERKPPAPGPPPD